MKNLFSCLFRKNILPFPTLCVKRSLLPQKIYIFFTPRSNAKILLNYDYVKLLITPKSFIRGINQRHIFIQGIKQ